MTNNEASPSSPARPSRPHVPTCSVNISNLRWVMRGATFDPAQGTWFVLDVQMPEIVRAANATAPGSTSSSLAPQLEWTHAARNRCSTRPTDSVHREPGRGTSSTVLDATGKISKTYAIESLDLR